MSGTFQTDGSVMDGESIMLPMMGARVTMSYYDGGRYVECNPTDLRLENSDYNICKFPEISDGQNFNTTHMCGRVVEVYSIWHNPLEIGVTRRYWQ